MAYEYMAVGKLAKATADELSLAAFNRPGAIDDDGSGVFCFPFDGDPQELCSVSAAKVVVTDMGWTVVASNVAKAPAGKAYGSPFAVLSDIG